MLNYRTICCFFIFYFYFYSLFAIHFGGGILTYEHLGYDSTNQLNDYKITLSLTRVCVSNFEPHARLGIYIGNDDYENNYQELILFKESALQLDVTKYNCLDIPHNKDYCKVSYSSVITLPIINESYYIAYQKCCRTSILSNVFLQEDGAGMTYWIEISSVAQEVKNSSPQIKSFIAPTICLGEKFSFNFDISDIDGDSLAYELCSPLTDKTIDTSFCNQLSYNACPPPYDAISFINPLYDEINQLGQFTPINLGENGGYISFIPQLSGVFLIGICITEYRNNRVLSTVRMDLQFTIVPCTSSINLPKGQEKCDSLEVFFEQITDIESSINYIKWNFGDGNSSTAIAPYHIYRQPGEYDVNIVFEAFTGCSIDTTLNNLFIVRKNSMPSFYWSPNSVSNLNPTINLNMSEEFNEWKWIIDDTHTLSDFAPSYTFVDTGIHKVQLLVSNQYNCKDTSTQFIDVVPFTQVYIPNSFSPNSDGTNDIFKGEGLFFSNLKNYKMEIYNRWGGLIFQSFSSELGWNGQLENNKGFLPSGIYLYNISFFDKRQKFRQFSGDVLLLR